MSELQSAPTLFFLGSGFHARWYQVLKSSVGLLGTVAAIQGFSWVASIIVIRLLDVEQYALLTCCLAIQGLLGALADSGLAQAALTVGGSHYGDVDNRASVLQYCLSLVVRTSIAAVAITLPIWLWMVAQSEVSLPSKIACGFLLFGCLGLVLGLNVYRSFILLAGQRVQLQRIDILRNAARVVLVLVGLKFFPNAAFALFATVVAEAIGWLMFRKSVLPLLVPKRVCPNDIRTEIRAVLKRIVPASIYKSFSGQLFLLLLVAFGSTASVAGAGALSKFAQFFIFVPAIVSGVFNPRVARIECPTEKTKQMCRYTILGLGAAAVVWFVLVVFCDPLLALLGSEYAGLQAEMRVFVTAHCFFVMAGICGGLLNTRGWIIKPQWLIGADILFSLVAILTCDLSSVLGYVSMSCILNGGTFMTVLAWGCICLMTERRRSLV